MRDIGKNIRSLRSKKNITQDELAEKLFVSRQTISNYETGRSRPDVDTLVHISEILDVEVQELLYGPAPRKDLSAAKYRLLCGLVRFAVIAVFCVGFEHLITFFKEAPDALYLSRFVSGTFYSLSLILHPCLFLAMGWVAMQALSLLPKANLAPRGTKYARKFLVAAVIAYFVIVGIFCAWMIITNWQSYQHSLSNSTESFHRSFSVPIVLPLVRFFSNHRSSLWIVFIPLGAFLWLLDRPRQSDES